VRILLLSTELTPQWHKCHDIQIWRLSFQHIRSWSCSVVLDNN